MRRILSFFGNLIDNAPSALAVVAACLIVSACTPKEEEAIDEIVIEAVTPSSGDVTGGYPLTISGSGFTFIERVTVGGVTCPVTAMDSETITCTAPAQTAGTVTVSITGKAGRSDLGTFTYVIVTPDFASSTPTYGNPNGGTTVYVTGTGFSTATRVFIGPKTFTVGVVPDNVNECETPIVFSPTYLSCSSPVLAVGTYDIHVWNPNGGTDTGVGAFSVNAAPTFTSISPALGPTTGSTLVTITGSGFLPGVRMQFGTAQCTNVIVDSSTSVRCRTPVRPKGIYALRITNRDLQTVLQNAAYEYNDTALITSVLPTAGAIAGGTNLTISGNFFTSATTVTINSLSCPVVPASVTSSSLRCTTPANAVGAYNVTVVNPGTTAATLTNGFTYQEAPTLTSVTPTSGPSAGGVPITIVGNYFRTGAVVSIGGSACTVTARTLTSITCTPAAAVSPGANTITVTNLDAQTVTGLSYTYVAAPTFTSVAPAVVRASGGTSITITGTGFQSIPAVRIGTDDCLNEAFVSATSITCDVPVKTAGVYALTVTNPDGQAVTSSSNITLLDLVTVTSISPSAGALAGGTNLTVAGTNFFAGAVVTIGGTPCTSTNVISPLAVSCVGIPTVGAAGAAAVVVTNVDGQSSTPTNYTYQDPPTASTITPNTGVIGGGYTVVVSGSNFLTGATVSLGAVTCGTPTVDQVLDTITCLVPAAPSGTGTVNVVVTNPDGQISTITGGFSFTPPPDATGISPAAIATGALTRITITGTSFLTPTVTVGPGPDSCALFSSSATSIVCDVTPSTAGAKTITVTNSDGQTDTLTGLTAMNTPTITTRSPTAGPVAGGGTLTIDGTNFYAGATVTVGGLACTSPNVSSATRITCTLPAGVVGSQDLVVRNLDTQVATLLSAYTYNNAPTITNFAPTSGFAGGTTVTITGTNFITGLTAEVGSTPCTSTTFVSATSVDCVVPAGTGAATIKVTNPDGQQVTSSGSFTYVPAPIVTGISPAVGRASGGTLVTVTGNNFVSGATITINGVPCGTPPASPPAFVSATTLTCTTSATTAGSSAVTVQNPDSQSSAGSLYTFYDPPTIAPLAPATASVIPDGGATTGGTSVTITGTNFAPGATSVTIGGISCSGVSVNGAGNSLTCTSPGSAGGASGAVNVIVTTVESMTVTRVGGYTFRPKPDVSSVTPAFGQRAGGTTVTIEGSGFFGGALPPTVLFDDSTATCFSGWSNNAIVCTTPPESVGLKRVTVINSDGQSAYKDNVFNFLEAPTITSLSPIVGSVAGGTTITILGANFFSGASVTVDGVACTSRTVVSSGTITCVVPAGSVGAKTVAVTNVDGQSGSRASAFTYQVGPTVTAVLPTSGPPVGGNIITITGTGFLAGATVRMSSGGTSYLCTSVTVVSSTSITCVTPAASAGYYSVVVTNTSTLAGTLTSGFRYRAVPTITSLSSTGGPLLGGQTFSIIGAGFENGDIVSFGDAPGFVNCSSTVFSGTTQLQCTTAANAAGTYNLNVHAGASTATKISAYTYRAEPTVGSILPIQGLVSGGTTVTIGGSGFIANPTVKIGTANCTNVNLVSALSITCVTPPGILGDFAVQVTNADGQYSIPSVNFTYVNLPLVAFVTGSMSPTPPISDTYGPTTTNVTHTYTIRNSGTANATVTSTALTGTGIARFTLGTDNCTGTILPNATCTIQVTFLGATGPSGTFSAALEVNGSNFTKITNTLSGIRP